MVSEKAIGYQVRTLNNMIKRDVERSEVFQYGQSTGLHGWAIGWLYQNREHDVFQRDFEQQFSIRRSTASNILALMEKNGMIRRESVDYDARLKKLVLTERAIEFHRMILQDIEARDARLKKNISPGDLECFFKVIGQIKANLEEEHD